MTIILYPVELLVSIIVFESNSDISLTAKWDNNSVKIKNKKAYAIIMFNQPVTNLRATVEDIVGSASATDDNKVWKIEFANINAGEYEVAIVANGKFVQVDKLIINSAIGNNGGDFDL